MRAEKNQTEKIPPGFSPNPQLDKYVDKVLFQEKLNLTNQILKKVGIPTKITS